MSGLTSAATGRERGVALIITLILLSVTLLMALAFLAVSNRARNAANTASDSSNARLAADAALASAEAQAMANILTATNPYNLGLLVSTNYINTVFQPGIASPTNVNYNGATNSTADLVQNIANLQILPRAPVLVSGAEPAAGRFYYDLNRNGVDDPSFSGLIGDPEWIGVLERSDKPHGPDNHFIARFMFFAMPIGNGLDLNAMHNQVFDENNVSPTVNPPPTGDTFFRNQGVDSSELNLAAFLADLNTNQWTTYSYNEAGGSPNSGTAFDDARAMLAYRYGNTYNSLASVTTLFGANGAFAFTNDNIDGYGDGQLQTASQLPGDVTLNDNPVLPWAGADNTNHFFTLDELFDPTKTSGGAILGFTNRLLNAGNGASTYDRYTFYRLLSQLGTDSSPESGKMNLNYDNLNPYVFVAGNPVLSSNGVAAATNFVSWQPLAFFTNAADRLLRAYTAYWRTGADNFAGFTNTFGANTTDPFGVTGIPVWMEGRFVYTPTVNRVLQLAANIYDATTTNYYPSVFRPIFSARTNNGFVNVFITGYTDVNPTADPANDPQMNLPVDVMNVTGVNVLTNVYGVPWIIGAKKGFPNFNSFTLESVFGQTRKIQVTRDFTNLNAHTTPPANYTVSQEDILGITNMLEVECWNSYKAAHIPKDLIFVTVLTSVVITNDEGVYYPTNYPIVSPPQLAVFNWPGYGTGSLPPKISFVQPLYFTNELILTNVIYTFIPPAPFVLSTSAHFVTNTLMPEWGLQITNRLRVFMVESNSADGLFHVIDYVHLAGPDSSHDVSTDTRALYDTSTQSGAAFNGYNNQWDTTLNAQGWPNGIDNQIGVSRAINPGSIILSYWTKSSTAVIDQINCFRAFYGESKLSGGTTSLSQQNAIDAASVSYAQQAPYSPSAPVSYTTRWEANDPLVHYLGSDLTDNYQSTAGAIGVVQLAYGNLNKRYMPWGGRPILSGGNDGTDLNPYNSALKDPLVKKSDNWDFPTGKLPTTGWLGRVHRGTPWQTVYLKSSAAPNTTILTGIGGIATNLWMWQYVTGNLNFYDASNSVPTQDRLMFDLFTTAFNDNASRGQLSVNVGAGSSDPSASLASWSALFSGMVVPTNSAGGYAVIQPAGIYDWTQPLANTTQPPLAQLAAGIVQTRANHMNPDGVRGVFERAGSILGTPQLSEQSPYLAGLDFTNAVTDEMVEWLPQQMMSLVRVGSSRYVIYSYGQTLKPAQGGIYTQPGPFFGLVTNYQVVAEIATRAVVRFDATVTNIPTANGVINMVTNNRAVIESFNILPPN